MGPLHFTDAVFGFITDPGGWHVRIAPRHRRYIRSNATRPNCPCCYLVSLAQSGKRRKRFSTYENAHGKKVGGFSEDCVVTVSWHLLNPKSENQADDTTAIDGHVRELPIKKLEQAMLSKSQ